MTATHCLGIGHETDAEFAAALALVQQCCRQAGLGAHEIAMIGSLEAKATGDIVAGLARHFGWPAQYFTAATLEAETPRLLNPSDAVFRAVGCHGVAEGAALAAAGPHARLVIPKTSKAGVTCAIARRGGDGR